MHKVSISYIILYFKSSFNLVVGWLQFCSQLKQLISPPDLSVLYSTKCQTTQVIEIEKHVGGCPPSSEQQLQSSPSPISWDSHSNTGETYGFEIDSGSELYGGNNSELRHRKTIAAVS